MRVYRAYTVEFEHALAEAGHPDLSLALGTNIVRFLDGEGRRLGSIAELAGVSKQAISQQVAYLKAKGYVVLSPDPHATPAKLVHPPHLSRQSQPPPPPLFLPPQH